MNPFCIPALALATALLCSPAVAHEYYARSFKVIHPWAEATPAGARSAAVYLGIEQISEGDRLLSAQTSFAERVELRTASSAATPVVAIDLPAGPDIQLDAGSAHLQLVNLTAPLQSGRSYPMTLTFEKSGQVDVMISVGAH